MTFHPPTPKEVHAYAQSIDFELDGDAFIDYYQSQGWKKANGRPLTDWKCAVRTWKRRDIVKKNHKTKLYPLKPFKHCSKCYMPAVYKDSKGDYDYYTCAEHMPIKVKEKFE